MAAPLRKRSVLAKIFITIMVGFTALTISTGVWLWFDVKHDRYKDLTYTANVLKSYYTLSFHQWEHTLFSVGKRLTEIEGDSADYLRWEYANDVLKVYDELLAFGFTDTSGQVLTFTGLQVGDSLPHLMKSENSRRSFLQAKSGNSIDIGEAYYFPNVKDWIIPIRMPIRAQNGDLLAVNTSAIEYQSIVNEIAQFGFDKRYQFHLINKTFNTSQFYFPLDKEDYETIISRDVAIYQDVSSKDYSNSGISVFSAKNSFNGTKVIGVRTQLENLDHELIVTLNRQVLMADFIRSFRFIALGYVIIFAIGLYLFVYFRKKEKHFVNGLKAEKANLNALFESTNSIIGLFDKNLRLLEFNTAFKEYARLTDNIELKQGTDILSQMKHQEFAELFRRLLNKGLNGEKVRKTLQYPGPDGPIFFQFNYNPIYHEKEITGVSLYVENITELKASQAELEQLNQNLEKKVQERTEVIELKNQELEEVVTNLKEAQQQLVRAEKMASIGILAAGIGHEINNPLNFIKNGVFALGKHIEQNFKGPHDSLKQFYDIIGDGVNRATNIVKSLSHFSRKTVKLDEQCEIHEIIDNCLVILNTNLRDKVEVKKHYRNEEIVVKGNEGKLHQAFLNIIANAEQAIEDKGTIDISTAQINGKARIKIKDDGVGIKENDLQKIGDPFFTTKPPGQGTGLGLFITYSIIEEHKGTIAVSSKNGEGTEFIIDLNV
jgi:PAS domain S-box-containing protein